MPRAPFEQPLTIREVALRLGVHYNTVQRMPPHELPYWRFGNRGDRKYDPADVEAYVARRQAAGDGCRCVRCVTDELARTGGTLGA